MTGLDSLPNLGPASIGMLTDAQINTRDDLASLGPVVAFLAVRQAGHRPSMNLLWAIHGALIGVAWNEISESDKSRLRRELDRLTR